MLQGFLLGLANGGSCLAYCSPVMIPLLMGRGEGIKSNSRTLAQFLAGRYLGYLIFAFAAWSLRHLIVPSGIHGEIFRVIIQLIMAALLLYFGIAARKTTCAVEWMGNRWAENRIARSINKFFGFPFSMGFLTGLNLCPPFIALFAGAMLTNGLLSAFWLFSSFFIATSIFFLPFPMIGIFHRHEALKHIGQMAALLIGGYYFIESFAFLGGLLI